MADSSFSDETAPTNWYVDPNSDNSSDNDEEELMAITGIALYCVSRVIGNRRRPMHDSQLSGMMRVAEYLREDAHPDILKNKIRMDRATFKTISMFLEERQLLKPTIHLNVDAQLFIFLTIVCEGASNRQAQDQWQHSGETICRWFGKVLDAICKLKDEIITTPDYTTIHPFIRANRNKYRPWFDNCVGAIDGTHVPCVPPRSNHRAWMNRKGTYSQNVLAVVSFDMKFTYILLAGFEGSAHDARILSEAISNAGFPMPPEGKFYVADSGYANTPSFITPYRRAMYHIPEYRERCRGLNSREEVFNYTHSSLRNCIERTFGVWKKRFKILKQMTSYPIRKQVRIPVACAIIHNLIAMVREDDEILREFNQDGIPVRQIDPHEVDNNQPPDDVIDDIDMQGEPGLIHGTAQIMRDAMADKMWRRYQMQPWYRR